MTREELRYLLMDALDLYYSDDEQENRCIADDLIQDHPELKDEILPANLPGFIIQDTMVCFQNDHAVPIRNLVFLNSRGRRRYKVRGLDRVEF